MSDLDELLGNVTELAKGRSASKRTTATPSRDVADRIDSTATKTATTVPTNESPAPAGRPVGRPVGRPKAPVGERWEDQNKRAAFYLPHEMLDRIDKVSNRDGITKSDLVRRAIDDWLSAH